MKASQLAACLLSCVTEDSDPEVKIEKIGDPDHPGYCTIDVEDYGLVGRFGPEVSILVDRI